MSLSRWARGPRAVKEATRLVGDVILTVTSVPVHGDHEKAFLLVCAGESGVVYVMRGGDTDDKTLTLELEYIAHACSIFSLGVSRSETGTWHVFTGTAAGVVREDVVDISRKTVALVRTFQEASQVAQLEVLDDFIILGLRKGWLCCRRRSDGTTRHEVLAHGADASTAAELNGLTPVRRGSPRSPPRTRLLLTASTDAEEVALWELDAQQRFVRLAAWAFERGLSAMSQLSDRSGCVAVGLRDGAVLILDAWQRRVVREIAAHSGEVWDVLLTGPLVLSTGRDGTVAAHARHTGRFLFREETGWSVRLASTSPDEVQRREEYPIAWMAGWG
jgi:hypothetical protein